MEDTGSAGGGSPLRPPAGARLRQVGRRIGLRVAVAIFMVWAAATLTFFLVHALPGNPVEVAYNQLIQKGETPEQATQSTRIMFGFISSKPLVTQYFQYLWQLLHFNLGHSISAAGVPVRHLVLKAAPWTVIMVLSGVVVSFLIGVIAGSIAAVRRSTKLGDVLTVSGSLLHGIPQFVIALLLAYLFTTLWPIFPYGAPYSIMDTPGWNLPYLESLIYSAVLPVMAYALSSYGAWLLTMKSSVVTVLGDDFVLAAELRGLSPMIQLRYVMRNALLPLFTILALSIGLMFGGAVFIEQIFDYPGLGELMLNSISARDYPLMAGTFLFISVAVIFANLIADLLYTFIDPRVKVDG